MNRSVAQMWHQLAELLSVSVPLILGILNAATEPYWLDCPEFTASAQLLGIPHPPGHPLYVLLTKPFTLLPFGTIGLRVSVASAVFGALASWMLFRLTFLVLDRMELSVPVFVNSLLALVATLLACTSHAWWFQSVRQEVYALQMFMVAAALYPMVLYSFSSTPVRDIRLLYLSAFLFGLGLCNHHFIMLVAFPAAIPVLVRAVGYRGNTDFRLLGRMILCTLYGLLTYLFLPLRSAAGTPVALGGVHSLSDFFWVVSARVYQKSMTRESATYLQDTPLDAIFSIMGEMGVVIVVASLMGFYLLLRRRSTRLVGVELLLVASVTLFMRMIMGFDPFNPDYYGYILPTIAATAIGATVFVSVSLHVFYRSFRYASVLAPLMGVALFLVPLQKGQKSRISSDLSTFRATRIVYDAALGDAPLNTVVIADYYKLFFLLWCARYIDGSRPDVQVVNPHFFGYPGYLASVTKRVPEVRDLAWSIFVNREVSERALSTLAQRYALKVDPSVRTNDRSSRHLLPAGFLYNGFSESVNINDVQNAAEHHMNRWALVYRMLGNGWREHETFRFLSWSHYQDAIYFSRMGDRESARAAIRQAVSIGSASPLINDLEDALREGTGPLDVAPFLLWKENP